MINFTLIVFFIVILSFSYLGYKKGMANQLSKLVAMVVGLFTMALLFMLYSSFKNGEMRNTIYTVIIFIILGALYGIVSKLLKSIELIVKLPIIGLVNRLLGFILGMGMGLLFVWFIYMFIDNGFLSILELPVKNDIENSGILQKIHEYNIFRINL